MSSLGSPNPFFIAGKKAYEVERSLRFNRDDTVYLERTPSSDGNKRTWTFSAWIKRGQLTSLQTFFSAGSNNPDVIVKFTPSDQFEISRYGGSYQTQVTSTQLFRDPSAWYHLVGAVDTTQATASNRVKMYVNGTQITDFAISSYPSQDYEYPEINDTGFSNKIGKHGSNSQNFDGYMTEINFIDGSQLTPSSFAETDAVTGEYKPKKFVGSYGTNGFYLNFSDNSGTTATTLGKDYSGNGNNFTPYNFVTGDAVKDSPTNNFCLLNINDNNLSESSPHFVYSEGNLKAAWSFTGTNFDRVFGSLFIESSDTNKYYWEATGTQNNEQMVWGVIATDTAMYRANNRNTGVSAEANVALLRWASYGSAPYLYGIDQGSATEGDLLSTSNGNAANNDIFSFVFDGGTGKFYVWFKGVELSGQNYSAGTSVFDTVSTTKTYALMNYQGDGGGSTKSGSFTLNFGQDSSFAGAKTAQGNTDANGKGDFYYAVPTGAKALCTANLPNPTIKLSDDHFNTVLYTGNNNTSQNITGVGFQPDLVWVKNRDNVERHHLVDAVRGDNKVLFSNEQDSERTGSHDAGHTQLNLASDGFNLVSNGSNNELNFGTRTYVAWNWNAGGSTASNGDGSISSSVRANTSAGFSIAGWTGTNGNGTVGHGLGVAPKVIIVRRRDSASDWAVYHGEIGNTKRLVLNSTAAESGASANWWNNTSPTSTTFSVGSDAGSNGSTDDYIAYCFSEVAGYSKFGSYTGNQNADGTFVYLGFTPAWIMIKNADNASNRQWCIIDATRTTINKSASAEVLFANDSQSESVANNNYGQFASKPAVDILSNGFKVREGETTAYTQTNRSNSHIYLAFAESPFKYARAR